MSCSCDGNCHGGEVDTQLVEKGCITVLDSANVIGQGHRSRREKGGKSLPSTTSQKMFQNVTKKTATTPPMNLGDSARSEATICQQQQNNNREEVTRLSSASFKVNRRPPPPAEDCLQLVEDDLTITNSVKSINFRGSSISSEGKPFPCVLGTTRIE